MSVIVSAAQVKWYLKQLNTGKIFEVDPSDFRVGRCPTAQVILNSNKASRTHSSFVVNVEGRLLVQDLKSVNGTFVNGKPIEVYVRHRVMHGDVIGFGISHENLSENEKDRNTFFEVYMEIQKSDERVAEPALVDSTTDTPCANTSNGKPIEYINLIESDDDEINDISINKNHLIEQKVVSSSGCIDLKSDVSKITTITSAYDDLQKILNESLNDILSDNSIITTEGGLLKTEDILTSNNFQTSHDEIEIQGSSHPLHIKIENPSDIETMSSNVPKNILPDVVKVELESNNEISLGSNICTNLSKEGHGQIDNEDNCLNVSHEDSLKQSFSTNNDVSVIDITDDEDEDFSCSQIFQMSEKVKTEVQDHNFQKIKQELSEMDCFEEEFILNQLPINLEDNFDHSGFENTQDMCAFLEEDLVTVQQNNPDNCKDSLVKVKDDKRKSDRVSLEKEKPKRKAILIEPQREVAKTKLSRKSPKKTAVAKNMENTRTKRKNSLEETSNKKKLKPVSPELPSKSDSKNDQTSVKKRRSRSNSKIDGSTKAVKGKPRKSDILKDNDNKKAEKKELENLNKDKSLAQTKTRVQHDQASSSSGTSINKINNPLPYQLKKIELPHIDKIPINANAYLSHSNVRSRSVEANRNLRNSNDQNVKPTQDFREVINRESYPLSYFPKKQSEATPLYQSSVPKMLPPHPFNSQLPLVNLPSSSLMYPSVNPSNERRLYNRRMISNNNAVTEDIVHKIVHWLPNWLVEQIDVDVSPPINNPPAHKIPLYFQHFEQYYDTFPKLVLLEMWQFLFKGFRESKEQPQKAQVKHIRVCNNLLYIDCLCYLSKEEVRKGLYYKSEDFLLLECRTRESSKCYLSLHFGFINRCKKLDILENPLQNSHSSDGKPYASLEFTIVTRNLSDKKVDSNGAVLLKLLANVGAHLKQIKAIKGLMESALCSKILNPKVNNFRFPITIKKLSVPNILNLRQKQIVIEAASVCTGSSSGIYCIKGPPGTGKTCVIVNLVFQILMSHYITQECIEPPMILLAAPSNTAVDNMLSKLVAKKYSLSSEWDRLKSKVKLIRIGPEASISEEGIQYSLSSLAKKHILLKNKDLPGFKVAKENKETMLDFAKKYFGRHYMQELKVCEDILVKNSNIICTTLNSCVNGKLVDAVSRGLIKFTCCIIDESTQCHEVESLLPTTLGIDKFVLVGDPKQLNATVMNREAMSLGYGESLFNRFYNNFVGDPRSPIRMLTDQYRMHPEICYFPNKEFYDGKLNSVPDHSNKLPDKLRPYLVFSCEKFNESAEYTNVDEVNLIRKLLQGLIDIVGSTVSYTVGIITPYNAQKDLIIQNINDLKFLKENCKITVNTVDSFQGSENDVIIISTVRYSTNSFLQNENRLNVALTRAKQILYFVGNYTLFKECRPLYDLREDAKRRKVVIDIKNNPLTIENFSKCLVKED